MRKNGEIAEDIKRIGKEIEVEMYIEKVKNIKTRRKKKGEMVVVKVEIGRN